MGKICGKKKSSKRVTSLSVNNETGPVVVNIMWYRNTRVTLHYYIK